MTDLQRIEAMMVAAEEKFQITEAEGHPVLYVDCLKDGEGSELGSVGIEFDFDDAGTLTDTWAWGD